MPLKSLDLFSTELLGAHRHRSARQEWEAWCLSLSILSAGVQNDNGPCRNSALPKYTKSFQAYSH